MALCALALFTSCADDTDTIGIPSDADIITSSLGYNDYDTPDYYHQRDLDGQDVVCIGREGYLLPGTHAAVAGRVDEDDPLPGQH